MSTVPEQSRRRAGLGAARDWLCLLLATAARVYLVLMAALLAIALLPMLLGWSATVVQTGSMGPHIDPGDVVVVAPWDEHQPVPIGRVVTFTSPAGAEADGVERQHLHRIIGTHEDGTFLTAGDANAVPDSTPLRREQITGEARLLVPYLGLPAQWLRLGKLVAFAGWVLVTAAALWLVARHSARVARWEAEDAEGGDSAPDAGVDGDPPPSSAGARGEVAARRTVLGVFLAASVAVAGLLRAPATSAAFTARTGTTGSTWTVAERPELSLGRAASYRVLASTEVTNDPWLPFVTAVRGSVGTSPGTDTEGLYTSWLLANVTGEIHRNTAVARQAMGDAQRLFRALEKLPVTQVLGTQLRGTLRPGVHELGRKTLEVRSVTLDAQGDESARFVIRAPSLRVRRGTTVTLRNGARADNVFWCATDDIEVEESTTTHGILLAQESIVLSGARDERSELHGRAISTAESVDMEHCTVGP